jgi:alkanesulfonate monooxygenase SsuD/methylene tetrahydromethanopterin reductase-like flavin-dependent oxidoreductase (luciferase family)
MRFNLFHLMPWPHLPADFDERYSSASVTLPNSVFDPERGADLYNDYLDQLEYAEELGFDAVCVNEHHQSAYGLMPSPNIISAALARRTERIQIAVLGNAIAIRDHPLRVAEEIAMLDNISRGRIISGFVRGIGFEYFQQSVDPNRSRERFREAHDLIVKAWTTRDLFEWHSPNYHFRYVNVWPRPLQQPHPPVWVPGTGSRETMRWVAERRYHYLSVYAPARVIKSWFDGFRAAAADVGYEPDPEQIGLLLPIFVGDTDAKAMAEARQHIEWLYHRGLKITNELYFPAGYLSSGSLRGMLSAGVKPFSQTSFEELIEERYVIIGSPSTVGEKLEALRQELGFGNLCALLHIGDMSHERALENMDLFAREVMPQFERSAVAAPSP